MTQIERYRSKHTIRRVVDHDEGDRMLNREVCGHCHIEIHRIRGGYRHDIAAVKAAAARGLLGR